MGRWYKVAGQYYEGNRAYGKTYIVFAESSSSADQKIFHLRFPSGCSFLPCTTTELDEDRIYSI